MSKKKVSSKLKQCLLELQTLQKIRDPKIQKLYLDFLAKRECALFEGLHEFSVNLAADKVPLTVEQKKKLGKIKPILKRLRTKTKDRNKRKKIVIQSGRGFPILIPILASLVGPIIDRVIEHVK